MWRVEDISIELDDEMTGDPVVTALVWSPGGILRFMAEPEVLGTMLVLHRTHVEGGQANTVGAANLMVLAQAVMERMDFDGLVVEGAPRTTGANPGRQPRALRFSR
jgi:hypothetical protein